MLTTFRNKNTNELVQGRITSDIYDTDENYTLIGHEVQVDQLNPSIFNYVIMRLDAWDILEQN